MQPWQRWNANSEPKDDRRRSRRLLGLPVLDQKSAFQFRRPPPLFVEDDLGESEYVATQGKLTNAGAYVVGDCHIDANGYTLGSSTSSRLSTSSRASGTSMDCDEADRSSPKHLQIEGPRDLLVYQRICGQGSSGKVRMAKHKPSGQIVALKEVGLEQVAQDKNEGIAAELKALHESRCPNVVSFYGAYYQESTISLIMEYMDAGSLSDVSKVCESNAIPEFYLAYIAKQVLQGLSYLHNTCRIIHRDIKPSNILVNTNGDVKIADFGVSGRLGRHVHNKDTFVGTVHYMSPERVLGQKHSFDSDIWSLGLTLMECALGFYPYRAEQRRAKTKVAFWDVMDIATQQPMPQLPINRFSEAFRSFVCQCVRKTPNQRPTASKLLRHPFITSSQCSKDMFQKFIKETRNTEGMDWVRAEKPRFNFQ